LVENCYSLNGTVDCRDTGGGFIGRNEATGTIRNCFALGGSVVNGGTTGGFVAYNAAGGVIENCYSTVRTKSTSTTNTATLANRRPVGGLVGENRGTIRSCYATGLLEHTVSYKGGLVGYMQSGRMDNCYFDKTTTGTTVSYNCKETAGTVATTAGLTTQEMKVQTNLANFNFSTNWVMKEGFYPRPKANSGTLTINPIENITNVVSVGEIQLGKPIIAGNPEILRPDQFAVDLVMEPTDALVLEKTLSGDWKLNVLKETTTPVIITATQSGDFFYFPANAVTFTVSITGMTTSIHKKYDFDVNIYPNVVEVGDIIHVKSNVNIKSLCIFSLSGCKVIDLCLKDMQTELPTSALKSGTYLMQIIDEKGSISQNKLIVL
jgi:hypothetical protein